MKKIAPVISLCLLLCALHASAQKNQHSLLWRISGNGLQQPSYLYGTFHMSDERLFNFGDSLYKAIENSKGFAIEVNPDEMIPYMVDMVKKEMTNNLLVKEMMNEKEFKKYSPALSKKLGKPAGEITTRDIFREKNKWVSESYRKGKMQTFVDAYLYDIARRQGKWMGGVEDMSDQANLLNDLVDESDIKQIAAGDDQDSKKGLETMMQAYINSNLYFIDSIMNFSDSAYLDALLVKRNKKMAGRMDSLSRERTMVFAVGAAHLPGQEGLISLLRKKGFSVDPVFSSRKIKPENYRLKELDIPWVNVDDPNGLYHAQMPGKPGDIDMYGLINMKMYFNIFNGTGYLATSATTPYGKKGVDSLMAAFADNLFADKKMHAAKDITINGIAGKVMEKTDEEGYKRGFMLYKNNTLYMAVGFSTRSEAASLQEVKKFLDSYTPVENQNRPGDNVFNYADSLLSYSIDFPSKPQTGNGLGGSGDKTIKSSMMIAVDQLSGAYFIAGVNQTVPGYSIINDSTTLANVRAGLKDKFTSVVQDTMHLKNGRWVLEYAGMMKKANLDAKMYYEFRGNRWYGLIAMYDATRPNAAVDRFLHSFKLTGFQPGAWKVRSAPDSLFSTWMPAAMQLNDPKDTSDMYSVLAYRLFDSTRSDSYVVTPESLGKYYWQNSDSAFWDKLFKNNILYNDSVLYKKNSSNGNVRGIEFTKMQKGSLNAIRRRMLLYGDSLYTISTTQHHPDMQNSNVDRFFDDFRFNKPAPETHIYSSKAKLLLDDLLSQDSATRADAVTALVSAPFSATDLPLLHEALLKSYKEAENEYNSINETIAREIIQLKDSSSLIFAKKNYVSVSDKTIKNYLLDIISAFKTAENYKEMAGLLSQSPPLSTTFWSFTRNLKDSAKLTAGIYPELLPLLKDTVLAAAIIDAGAALVDSNFIPLAMLKEQQFHVLQYAKGRYKSFKADKEDYNSADLPMIHLLGKFNNTASNAMLQQLLPAVNNYVRIKCVEALITNNQPVNQQALLSLAADKFYRIELYNSLKKLKKPGLFPKQYLTQQSFAQSMVFSAASDDEEPVQLVFLTQKIISFKGKNARFFFYKSAVGEDDKVYQLACAGPFSLDATNMSADEAEGAVYDTETYDPLRLQQQIKALISEMEGWKKWDTEK